MNIVIGSWYKSIDSKINVSFKVLKFLRNQLINDILKDKELYNEGDNSTFYSIQITSDLESNEHTLSERGIDIENQMICFDFIFSLKLINESKSVMIGFLNGYYNLLNTFLSEISIDKVNIKNLKDHAFYELIDNEYYQYEKNSIASDLASFAEGLGLDED